MSVFSISYPGGNNEKTVSLKPEDVTKRLGEELDKLILVAAREGDSVTLDITAYVDFGQDNNLRVNMVTTDVFEHEDTGDITNCLAQLHSDRLLELLDYVLDRYRAAGVYMYQPETFASFVMDVVETSPEEVHQQVKELSRAHLVPKEYRETVLTMRITMEPAAFSVTAGAGFEYEVDDATVRRQQCEDLNLKVEIPDQPRRLTFISRSITQDTLPL